jgi:dihydrolipoamide dehydrogenase
LEVVPTAEQFDLVVIGGGPGGYAAALYGAAAGLGVAVVEKDRVGGTCLHRGCIPAKEFLETASVRRAVAAAPQFGIGVEGGVVDFAVSQERKQKIVDTLWKGLQGLMKRRKITVVHGFGQLGPHRTVKVSDGSELKGRSVVLASGSAPRTIPGFEVGGPVATSDEVLAWTELPASAVVVGGGAIGCEFASMMADMGVEVTLLEALPKVLAGCDKDVADVVVKSFKKRGMQVHTGVQDLAHQPTGDGRTTVTWDGGSVTVDKVVVSVGRRPFSDGLLLPGTSVEVDERGFVKVDGSLRTTEDGVYAVGDLIATPQLAHVGFAEGIQVVKEVLGESPAPIDYGRVPWCIYSHPEVAFVGLSEDAAREAGMDVVVKKDPFGGNGRAMIVGETEGLVKVIAEKDAAGRAGRVVGVHMVGPWVTEQLGQAYLSVNWEATVDEVAELIQPHPTLSEVFGETMLALTGRGLHS